MIKSYLILFTTLIIAGCQSTPERKAPQQQALTPQSEFKILQQQDYVELINSPWGTNIKAKLQENYTSALGQNCWRFWLVETHEEVLGCQNSAQKIQPIRDFK
jgi:PBP1b-binding outer membrane lipoprotein LpoB